MSPVRRWPRLDEPAIAGAPAAGITPTQDIPGHSEDSHRLKEYVHTKHAIARVLRSIQQLVPEQTEPVHERQCRELMVKLAEDRFTLAVVGQFKRGKSSLMNAIIGHELLPTGILPLTSTITIVRFGVRERLVAKRDNSIFDEEAPVSALPEYVTEQGNPGNQKKIQAVYVETPSPFLRRGLEFVDTPGIGSAIEANTETTMKFVPQCDAVLFVTGVDSPLTSDELYFLKKIREHVRKIFFVINKMDLAGEAEKEKLLKYVSDKLAQQMGQAEIRLFPVSSWVALCANESLDGDARSQSGIGTLEAAVADFLTRERTEIFLTAVIDKAIRLIAVDSAHAILRANAGAEAQRLTDRLHAIAGAIARGIDIDHTDASSESSHVPAIPPAREAQDDLVACLKTRGCPICALLTHVAFEFLAKWQHMLASSDAAQQMYAEKLGFCPLHAWQLCRIASPLGLSVGYPALAQALARRLAEATESSDCTPQNVRKLLTQPQSCAACQLLGERERSAAKRIVEMLKTDSFRDAYAKSQGPCLRHLASIVSFADKEMAQWLLANASQGFSHLAEDMQNYAMKRDALRRTLLNPDEDDAYLRAITHISGDRNLCIPGPADAEI